MNNSLYLKHFENKIDKISNISVGDYIKVGFSFKEGDKKRIQFFEGIIIAINKSNSEKKITLRKPGIHSFERIFSCKSPNLQNEITIQSQKFRKSKLFYLRNFLGKAAFGKKK